MRASLRFFFSVAIIGVSLVAVGMKSAAAGVQPCEVDIESDSGDGDDVCVVTTASPECTLANVIGHASRDKWCAIDDGRNYGAFIFLQDPVPVDDAKEKKRNRVPGTATLTRPVTLPGKIASDGSGSYNKGSGDPLVIAGYLLQYTTECMARGCSNPKQGDWEKHLLDGMFSVPPNPRDHPAYQSDRWGDESKNGRDMDPVIEKPDDGDQAVITVDLPAGDRAGFEAKLSSYVQFRHVTLRLRKGAAVYFDGSVPADLNGSSRPPAVSFLSSRIEVEASNPADHIFRIRDDGRIYADRRPETAMVMGGTTPVIISVGKAVTPESPFAIVDFDRALRQDAGLIWDLHNAIAFETPSLPPGLSLAAWPGAAVPSCRVVGIAGATAVKLRCRIDAAQRAAFSEGLVRLVEYDDPNDRPTEIIYTVQLPEPVTGDEIIVAADETVFTSDGRRIEIEMPECPDGTEAGEALTCAIDHGTFRGFLATGRWDFDCDSGYREDTAAGRCVLDCLDGTALDDAGTSCIVPSGYEWNIYGTQVSEECPGDPVPSADGSACVCKNAKREPVEFADGVACKKKCTDPDLMTRNKKGTCVCPNGYRKRSGKCVEATLSSNPSSRKTKAPAANDGDGDDGTDGDFTDAAACFGGLPCVDGGAAAGQNGGGVRGSPPADVSSGCSLAPVAGAAGGAWLIVFLGLGLILSSAKRRLLNGDRGGRDL